MSLLMSNALIGKEHQPLPHHRKKKKKKKKIIGKYNTHTQWILNPQPHPPPILMGAGSVILNYSTLTKKKKKTNKNI
jgi:hypothetical protein